MPTALLADDEPLLRAQLRTRLANLWPDLKIVHEAENGRQVAEFFDLDEDAPDVCFLDIHMPGLTGLEAARRIGKRSRIVFVTAFDQYAVDAFEQGAIDYVLKPFEEARLAETVARLKERLAAPSPAANGESDALDAILARLAARMAPTGRHYLQWIKASVGSTVRMIATDDICYFQSDEKYTRVVMEDGEVLIRKPIKELLEELDPDLFWQIHRSTLVNTRHIAGVVRGLRDQADLKLKSRPEVLTVSRAYTHLFKQM
ncbi:MAG: response regulator transcription factor [Betaproteobacteria bacterium]|nr:response regulator transcription factor [Betaproteobacteria bacterium]